MLRQILKNPTPLQLAILAGSIIAFTNAFTFLIISILFPNSLTWWVVIFTSFFTFGVATYVITVVLKRYIYRKVKVIYKTIHRLKRSNGIKTTNLNLRKHLIDEVEKEVKNWARFQSEELDSLKQMEIYRRNLLGNVSHELKTPIFNIQGYLYTLQDGAAEDEMIRNKYIGRAINNVERLNSIVQDLISISQLENGELRMEFQRFDIQILTQEIFDDLEFKGAKKGLSLEFKEGCNRPFLVYADRESIRQVLTNLLSNSIKYGKENGTTKVGFYNMDKNILIEVTDDGIGIDSKHLPHLFERFYRADKGRSRDEGGTGLGLSIVKHIIEAHNQTINVRSRPNLGSTFGFTLKKA